MIKETIDLKLLSYFVATAEKLSFTLASRTLNIPKSVLSKSIVKLEAELGSKVFERSSRVVRLTESGHLLYSRAVVLLDDANHLLNDLKTMQNSVSGRLKLAAPPALGRFLAKDIIPPFLQQWPDVSISLKLSYEYEDLFRQGLDLSFRMGKSRDQNLIERPLGFASRVVVASPDYLAGHNPIRMPEDLLAHKSVQFFEQRQQLWTLENGAQTEQVALDTIMQCADFVALVNAVSSGVGVAQLPWLVVRDEIRSGHLCHVLPAWLSTGLPISLVYRDGHNKSAKLAEFLAWVELNQGLFDLRFNG